MIVTQSQQLLGIGLLVLVNVVWVLSAELTRYLFIDLAFARPFFFTYAKSCMLSLLLLRYSCSCTAATAETEASEAAKKDGGGRADNEENSSKRKSGSKKKKANSTKTTKSGTAIYTQLENIGEGSDDGEEEEEEEDETERQGQTSTDGRKQRRRRSVLTMTMVNNNTENMNNNISLCSSSTSSSSDGTGRVPGNDEECAELDSERSYEATKLTSVEFERFKLPSSATTDESELCSEDEALLRRDPVELDDIKRKLFDALVNKKARQQQRKRVRFSCIRQVRALPEKVERDARLARLPYHRHISQHFQHCPNCPALSRDSALFSYAVIFAPLWMISSMAFQTSLAFASVTTVNLFSASSPLFVLMLGAFFGKNSADAFTGTKLALVLLNLSGVCVVSRVSASLLGSAIAMFSAVVNAIYLFTLSRFAAKSQRQVDAILLLGVVGLFSLVVCTPLLLTVHNLGIERQLPLPTMHQMVVLTLNAFIGTLIADSLWLYATLLTGGLTSSLSGSLGIPLSMVADAYLRNQPPNAWQVLSSIPIMISFLGASLITMPRHHRTSASSLSPSSSSSSSASHKAKCSPPSSASSSLEDALTAPLAPFEF